MHKTVKKLTIEFPVEEFKYLKMACAQQDISIKDFVTNSIIRSIEDYENGILFEDSFNDNDGENFILLDKNGVVNDL